VNRRLNVALAAVVVLAFVACSSRYDTPRKGKDTVTLSSPDGRSIAKVREVNIDGSVMVSQPYQVLLEAANDPSSTQVMLLADKTGAPRLIWKDAHTLAICFADAQIYHFVNFFFIVSENSNDVYQIDVLLLKRAMNDPCQ
jgi:hypothetical protein